MNISDGVRAALEKVWKLGRVDGCEHFIALRDDKEYLCVNGEKDRVDLNPYKEKFRDGDVVVHNHPNSLNSFSDADLMFAGGLHSTTYVIADDKSIYRAKFREPRPPVFLAKALMASTYMQLNTREAFDSTNSSAQHVANVRLRQLNLIEYEYELQEPTKQLIERELQEAVFERMGYEN